MVMPTNVSSELLSDVYVHILLGPYSSASSSNQAIEL